MRNPEGEPARSLYLVNDIVKSAIRNNDYRKMRLTAAGTKIMAKQEAGRGNDAQFRILGEGLPIILPFIDESTILTSDLPPLRTLLTTYYPLISSFDAQFREAMQERCTCQSPLRLNTVLSLFSDGKPRHQIPPRHCR